MIDSGSATYTVNNPYWLDTSLSGCNGYIAQTTNLASVCGGGFGANIGNDASGTGYFLFTGTAGTIPTRDEFYITPSFSVSPNTTYTVSFWLTNANTINNGQVEPEIDSTILGSASSAIGTFSSSGWQQFTYTWNSGSNSSASLILHDLTPTSFGNDFGLDNIDVSATTPEPGTFGLLAGVSLLALLRRRLVR